MLARGRCVLNSWKKNLLFTSIYSPPTEHFLLPYLDAALIVNQFMKGYRHSSARSSPNEKVRKIFLSSIADW